MSVVPATERPTPAPRPRQRHASQPVPGPSRWLRWLLPIRLAAVLSWEVAAAGVLVAYAHRDDVPLFYPALVVAAVIVVATSIRLGGLTAVGRLRTALALRRRRREHAADPADSIQRRLLPGLTLNTHIDRAGNRTGLIGAGLGWSAVVRVADAVTPDPDALIEVATRACLRSDLPLAAAQVLTWNVPSTWNGTPGTLRQFFVAVRTAGRPSGRAIRARGGGPAGAQRTTASAAAAVAFELTRLGYSCTVLDSAELEQYVQLVAGASAEAVPAEQAPRPVETKDALAVGRVQQSCLRVGGGTPRAEALLWPAGPPLSFVVGSCTVRPGPAGPRLSFLVRTGLVGQQSPLSAEQATRALDRRLIPLRGQQEPSVRASLPLALGEE